jgi:hypothetical protein
MNIDERLEALTQTVELLAAMHRDSGARFERMTQGIQELTAAVQKDGEHIRALAHIAEIHHERLSHLEGDTR